MRSPSTRFRQRTLACLSALLILGCNALSPERPLNLAPTVPVQVTDTGRESPGDTRAQLDTLENLWDLVNEEYLYEDFNGVDWDAALVEYRARVQEGLSDAAFYLAMDEMIASLGDDHSVFLSPEEAAEEDALFAGNLDYAGIGILSNRHDDAIVVLLSFPDGPAFEAGIRSHDRIFSVDGVPLVDENGEVQDIIRGPEGTDISLTVSSPGEPRREVVVTRGRITGSMPVPYRVIDSPGGKRIGYILIVTFSDGTVAAQLGDALEDMTRNAPLDGLIIDNRLNEGGADSQLKGTLAYFISGPAGYFVNRSGTETLEVDREDIRGSQDVPLVVLVGLDTVSYGEVFAGVLKDLGRAYLIGETTEGNVETLWGYDFSDGSRAWIAHDSFRPFNNPEEDWEQTGIIPDDSIPVRWEDVTFETDPAIAAAIDYLDGK